MKSIQGPKGRIYPEHSPKRVALVGMGPSFQDYLQETMTQELTPEHHDEVWGINMIGNALRCDLIFWMDDLKTQAEMQPHLVMPTKALKTAVSSPHGIVLEQAGGEPMKRFVGDVMSLPEIVRQATYDSFATRMDQLVPSLGNAPLVSVMAVKQAFAEDRAQNYRDPNSTLAGLIGVLDRHKTPVMTAIRRPEYVENSFDFPIDEVCGLGLPLFGKPYLNNGVAMAIAYALWKGVEHLKIYGCDFTYPNREYAEEGRACVEAWITNCIKSGMQIGLPQHTSIMDMVKSPAIYGYSEPPEIEFQGKIYKFGTETLVQSVPQFKAPDTRDSAAQEQITHELSKSDSSADSATRQPRSKRGLRTPAGSPGPIRPAVESPG